jgi:hypothetical protein
MRKEDAIPIASLFALACLYFLPVLIKGESQVLSSVGADIWGAYYYWRHFGFQSLAGGEIPLWNPYSFSGLPFVAGMESAIFYPPNLIYLFFGTAFSINLSIALHCFLAGLFTYLFARYMDLGRAGAVLSAVTFVYGAPCFLRIYAGHLVGLAALTWLPLLLMSAEAFLRKGEIRCVLWGGLVLSMQFLAGQPQYLFYSMIAVSLYFFINLPLRKELREAPYFFAGFCLLVLTGLFLSAVQLFPSLELTRYSVRNALGYEWVSTFSLPPENLTTLLLPDFFGNLLTVPYWGKNYLWEMSVYVGIVPLILGATAIVFDRSRPVLIFSSIAAVSVVLALGKHTPLFGILYAYVPGFNLFRGLSKFVVEFSFAWSMLAGYGLKKLTARPEETEAKTRALSYTVLAVALLLVVIGVLGILGTPDFRRLWTSFVKGYEKGVDDYLPVSLSEDFFRGSFQVVSRDLFRAAIILLVFGGLLLLVVKLKNSATRLFIVAVLALTALDLWTFGARYLVSFNPEILYMDRELKAFFKSDKEPFRLATPIATLLNVGFLEGTKDVGGYDQLTLRNYNEFINFSQGLPLDKPNFAMVINRASPMLDLLNVRYYVLDDSANVALPYFHPVFQNSRYKVYRNSRALPRTFVVHDARVIKGREDALQALASPTFNPTSTAIVDEAIDGLPGNPALRSPVPTVLEDLPRKIVIRADLKEAGLLVLGDVYYPGWKVFVDDQETRIYQVNHAMRGVFLSKGRHLAEFRYDPLSFKLGAVVSLASLVLVAAFLLWRRFTIYPL